jgi:hypothetical protein
VDTFCYNAVTVFRADLLQIMQIQYSALVFSMRHDPVKDLIQRLLCHTRAFDTTRRPITAAEGYTWF